MPIAERFQLSGEEFSAFVQSPDFFGAVVTFVVMLGALWILKRFILFRLAKWAGRSKFRYDDLIVSVLTNIGMFFYVAVSAYAATRHLTMPEALQTVLHGLFLLAVVAESVKLAERVISYLISVHTSNDKESRQMSNVIKSVIRLFLWTVGLLLILSNLGFNVTSLVAGLGIGGLAVSLATQNILSDMFNSFSLAMDKPFEEGDFINVGVDSGTVEKIGLKTTRIRTLRGEQLVISNSELTTQRIQNFRKLQKRRVPFIFNVVYETPVEKLKKIPAMIQAIIEKIDKVEFDRAHMIAMGEYSLQFEVIYNVQDQDYNTYLNAHQSITLELLTAFEKEGIKIAYPTRTILKA